MKAVVLSWLATCLALHAGTLKFEKTLVELELKDDSDTLTVEFPFTATGDDASVIERYDGGCPCLTAGVKDSKLDYQPGETGAIRAVLDARAFTGTADKPIMIWLKGDPANAPSIKLTARVKVPVVIDVEPKSVMWEVGGKAEPKTVTITMNHSEPIKILSVSGSDTRFSHELKTVEEGKRYEIVVTPASTKQVGMGVIHVETDCKLTRHRSQRVFMVVRQPAVRLPEAAATGTP